jgi:hypothetical protein
VPFAKCNLHRYSPGGPGRDLEYCIVRPGGLGLGPPTGIVNVIDGEAGSIARADVADFCLGAIFEAGAYNRSLYQPFTSLN